MSLNKREKINTINELHENFELLNQSPDEIAEWLNTTEDKINNILNLKIDNLEEPWILLTYMNEELLKENKTPIKYSKLSGDYHQLFFLNSYLIDNKIINS
ncbi:DUF2316 family protein [Lactobacillus sp. S2-2]|uniref:DUF2316 family protein n=1 Tax=Lactobacillus sp. S2-2 TaxID=2692917 RepID=UPI001F168A9E|nr:DUF2316 family protein [Lactobacillus sp. S2-2]MCF6515329.1 DUF2316 family protein [Lactobacillus sp. S2-2]